MKINRAQKPETHQNKPFKPTTMFDIVENDYKKYVEKVQKSDMRNGLTRYLNEMSKLKQIMQYADKTDDTSVYAARIEEVKKILKDDFGVAEI